MHPEGAEVMDGDRDRTARTANPSPGVVVTEKKRSHGSLIFYVILALMMAGFVVGITHVLGLIPDNGREADGWMYTEVSLVPAACPALTKEVEALASRPKMTVGDAKAIGKRLWATSAESSRAWRKYEGRIRLGLKTGPKPTSCTPIDPRYLDNERTILNEESFEQADLENGRS
jgi:hypothetical protein